MSSTNVVKLRIIGKRVPLGQTEGLRSDMDGMPVAYIDDHQVYMGSQLVPVSSPLVQMGSRCISEQPMAFGGQAKGLDGQPTAF